VPDALDAWGDALVDRVRRDELVELGLAAFGDALAARARRRPRWRAVGLAAALAIPIAATSGAATALVLKTADVGVTDPAQVPDEQTPLAGTARVSAVRAADPTGSYPWAIRLARSKTGFTCTTVGQVHDRVFGIVGLDGVFRRLPGELSDACGQGGALVGARVVDGNPVRTIVYGAAGNRLQGATLLTARGERDLKLGEDGTFVAALTGYPEDTAAGVRLTFPGHKEEHNFGAAPNTVIDPEGGQAWSVGAFSMGTRYRCAQVRIARAPSGDRRIPVTPTACLGLKLTDRDWVADARVLKPGHHGAPGFDRWSWHQYPARTVVWGVARRPKTVESVMLLGAGAPRRLTIAGGGAFASVLPATVDPATLRLRVRLSTGETRTERPGIGLVPDLVKGRRPR